MLKLFAEDELSITHELNMLVISGAKSNGEEVWALPERSWTRVCTSSTSRRKFPRR
jgi:hypothetical protein